MFWIKVQALVSGERPVDSLTSSCDRNAKSGFGLESPRCLLSAKTCIDETNCPLNTFDGHFLLVIFSFRLMKFLTNLFCIKKQQDKTKCKHLSRNILLVTTRSVFKLKSTSCLLSVIVRLSPLPL